MIGTGLFVGFDNSSVSTGTFVGLFPFVFRGNGVSGDGAMMVGGESGLSAQSVAADQSLGNHSAMMSPGASPNNSGC